MLFAFSVVGENANIRTEMDDIASQYPHQPVYYLQDIPDIPPAIPEDQVRAFSIPGEAVADERVAFEHVELPDSDTSLRAILRMKVLEQYQSYLDIIKLMHENSGAASVDTLYSQFESIYAILDQLRPIQVFL